MLGVDCGVVGMSAGKLRSDLAPDLVGLPATACPLQGVLDRKLLLALDLKAF